MTRPCDGFNLSPRPCGQRASSALRCPIGWPAKDNTLAILAPPAMTTSYTVLLAYYTAGPQVAS